MSSIRSFLVAVVLATLTLTVFIAALRGYQGSMEEIESLFDQQLHDIAELLDGSAGRSIGESIPASLAGADSIIAFQVWENNRLLRRSNNTPVMPIVDFSPGYSDVNFSGYRWRALAWPGRTSGRWVLVAERVDTRFQLAESITLRGILPVIAGLPLAGILIWLVIGYGLRPLNRLAAELGSKRSDDLTALEHSDMPEELHQVVGSTNSLLRRLAAAIDREKRFSADAAHELRTPVSVLKVNLHNLLQEFPEATATVGELKAGVDRMSHLIEQILALYRTTPDDYMASFVEIDLHALAQDQISQFYPELSARQQDIELCGDKELLQGDAFSLLTLMQNLLSNASKYAPMGGQIRVTVKSESEGAVVLVIEDSGAGIPLAERDRVFERFYRYSSESQESGIAGCGLGLAIVRHIAELHRATISLGDSELGGLQVKVSFPRNLSDWGR